LLRHQLTVCVCGGNQQDSDFEGSLPLYDFLDEMLAFTNECLKFSGNALQHCLFITLSSMEVGAQLCVASILFLSVKVPMRWLTGNTHKLAHRNWGECSMGCGIDLLHSAFIKIQSDGSLLLDYDFIMKIICPLQWPAWVWRVHFLLFWKQRRQYCWIHSIQRQSFKHPWSNGRTFLSFKDS
jgi:hypothetical protein